MLRALRREGGVKARYLALLELAQRSDARDLTDRVPVTMSTVAATNPKTQRARGAGSTSGAYPEATQPTGGRAPLTPDIAGLTRV